MPKLESLEEGVWWGLTPLHDGVVGASSIEAKPRAVVLLSGGLDSATVAALALRDGRAVTALSFDYGQRQRIELESAKRVAESLGIQDHRVVPFDLSAIGGSALTSDELEVPKNKSVQAGQIPVTYVPARNTIFLSVAMGLAEVVGAWEVYFGANALDYSGYPDCRPAFVEAFEALAKVATRAADLKHGQLKICAPLIQMSKADIIQTGLTLGVDYSLTHSCYAPSGNLACGRCDACTLRLRGFRALGVQDPVAYVEEG